MADLHSGRDRSCRAVIVLIGLGQTGLGLQAGIGAFTVLYSGVLAFRGHFLVDVRMAYERVPTITD